MKWNDLQRLGTPAVLLLFAALFFSDATAASRRPGYLGVSVEKLRVEDREELKADFGVLVGGVSEDSPAEKAGIREDDVIQYFNGDKIRRTQDLTRRVRETKPGTQVKIGIVRDAKAVEVAAEIAGLRSHQAVIGGSQDRGFRISGRSGDRLGLRLQELNRDLSEYFKVKEDEGALVTEVKEDGPAEKAGIKAGDVIVQIDGGPVNGPDDVAEILSDRDEGDKVEITLIRKGVKQTVKAEVEERNFNFRFNMPELNVHVPDIDIDVPDVPDVPHFNVQVDLDDHSMDELKNDMKDLKIELKNELKGLEELKELEHLDITIDI
jgi:C-terminal processing protease CtpA/Prc